MNIFTEQKTDSQNKLNGYQEERAARRDRLGVRD